MLLAGDAAHVHSPAGGTSCRTRWAVRDTARRRLRTDHPRHTTPEATGPTSRHTRGPSAHHPGDPPRALVTAEGLPIPLPRPLRAPTPRPTAHPSHPLHCRR
ncbi:hypothetical protein [Streptomyces huasconensis]|uniref:hypothetical protein n=1 Tax=Streptomyces TaxID=1883 RepID=UPI0038B4775F